MEITNESAADTIELDTLVDSVEGGAPFAVQGTCDDLLGTDLIPGASATCAFTLPVTGNAGDTVEDTVTVTAHDDDPIIAVAGPQADAPAVNAAPSSLTASASAVVGITDVPPTGTVTKTGDVDAVPESGGSVVFTVLVTNTSPAESVTVTSITDTIGGNVIDLTSTGGAITATTCEAGSVLAPGGTYGCEFTYAIPAGTAGDIVTDTVTVTLTDDEDNHITPSDTEEVVATDVAPTITVVKDNGDAEVAAPGAEVDFDVAVTNTSFEPVTLTTLTDSVDGGTPFDVTTVADPVTATTCEIGGVIAPGGTYNCTFTLVVASDQAATVPDEVIAGVVDDDDTPASAADDAVTTVTASADVAVDKRLASDGLIPGGEGTYELVVSNDGPSDAAGVVVVDTLPEGLTAKEASGDGWTCTVEPSVVTCERVELLADTSSTITIVVDVDLSVAGTTVTNVADVESETEDPDDTNNHDEEVTDVGDVEPEQQTPPTTTVPSASPIPAVVESLARTGSSPAGLATAGFLLLLVGVIVLVSRRLRIARSV